jgi:cytochrome P450
MDENPTTEPDQPPILPTGPRVDPYPMYAELRERTTVQPVREPNGLRRWLILRHGEARDALADPRLSKDPRKAWDSLRAAGYVTSDRDADADYLYHLVNTDPPDHTRLRRLVTKAFTPRKVEELRPRATEIAEHLIDAMLPQGKADLIPAFSHPLSTTVICEMLGVPDQHRENFRIWATAMLTAPDQVEEGALSPQEGFARMRAFFIELLAVKRAALAKAGSEAPPDVLSGLIVASDEGNRLTEVEVVSMAMLLLSAGQEPTVNLINNGILALLRHPDQMALLRQRPELMDSAVEEFLRYDPPVELSTMRVSLEDIEIDGTVIPAGSVVTASLASTGRDERQFTEPDRLDITRTDNRHLAFGHGIHLCLGAPLARMEAQVGIAAMLRRLPDLALGCEPEDLRWRPTRIMRGLVELPITY